jgi:hypothetical protein
MHTSPPRRDVLDVFCTLALESDLSEEQLTLYAQLVLDEIAVGPSKAERCESLIASLRAMSAMEFAERVKRRCNGNATSTCNEHTSIHRQTRR